MVSFALLNEFEGFRETKPQALISIIDWLAEVNLKVWSY